MIKNAFRAMSNMKIYTKTGDKGSSSLYTGERRTKADGVFEALGSVDELNAHLGLAREHFRLQSASSPSGTSDDLCQQIDEIQARLLDVGSHIATPRSADEEDAKKIKHTEFDETHVLNLERWIDAMDENLPPLKNFILPSGGLAASQAHVARTVCRRAERDIVPLYEANKVD